MNRNISTVALISCLLITTCLAGCLEDDDDKTKPDFYGEVYWAENGFAYTFEEDGLKYTLQKIDGSCDDYAGGMMGELIDSSGDYCIVELDLYEYSSEDEGDYYEICVKEESGDDDDCIDVYPLSDGMVIKNDDDCSIFVSDISNPTLDEGGLTEEDWEDDWMDAAEDIYADDDAPNCEYDIFYAQDTAGDGLSLYLFEGSDAAGPVTDDINTQDDLVYVKMTQGDPLSWSVVRISIIIDDGVSNECGEEWNNDSACTYTVSDDQHWEVPYEILISEGDEDLCKPTTGKEYCQILVTVTKIGVGGADSNVLANEEAVAQ